jgi:mRNA-degrading endonuclease RelE of RelBE toxin-antitoxin system
MPTRTFEIEYGASAIEDLESLPEKPRNQILRKIEDCRLDYTEISKGCTRLTTHIV